MTRLAAHASGQSTVSLFMEPWRAAHCFGCPTTQGKFRRPRQTITSFRARRLSLRYSCVSIGISYSFFVHSICKSTHHPFVLSFWTRAGQLLGMHEGDEELSFEPAFLLPAIDAKHRAAISKGIGSRLHFCCRFTSNFKWQQPLRSECVRFKLRMAKRCHASEDKETKTNLNSSHLIALINHIPYLACRQLSTWATRLLATNRVTQVSSELVEAHPMVEKQ